MVEASKHPEIIKARIRMVHGTIVAFEKANGISRDSVRGLLGGRPLRRTANAIAKLMGVSMDELFPGRFMPPVYKSRKRDAHRLNKKAA